MNDLQRPATDPEELSNLLAAIVESSDDAIISKTLAGVIVSWNLGAERIFGYTAAEAVGQPITLLIPADRLDEEPAILEQLRAGKRVDHFRTVRVRKDGSFVEISLTISPIRNAAGVIIGASKIARDVTREAQAEEALRVTSDRFRLMANSAPVMIWMADVSRARTWFNQQWVEFTGRPAEVDLEFGWTQSVHEEDLAGCLDAIARAFESRTPFEVEYRLLRADGEPRWINDHGCPLFEGPGGKFSGYIGSCVDISESKRLHGEREESLKAERAAREQAERLGRLKDEFLATVSHELRTPLNAILGWSTLLARLQPGSEDYARGVETIERNARLQAQLIADLLDMSAIISGKARLDVQPLDLQDVVTAAIDSIRPSVEAKSLRLRVTLDARAGRMRGDPARLQQVFWNLLTNAVKFTPSGGRIDVVLERVNSHVEVSVEDSGMGIKPEFLSFVFDRFRQADASATRRHGGLGLGLSITKHLVELHGGSVRAKSPGDGQGSTFVVALPISAMLQEQTGRPELSTPSDVDLESMTLPRLEGVRALVIDDEKDARDLICRLIESQGGRCIVAASAEDGLRVLHGAEVSIIVSDIGMPDVDGYQFMKKFRATKVATERMIPAIALTAFARPEDRQRALLMGYQMHIAKPVEPRELIAGIASLLNLL